MKILDTKVKNPYQERMKLQQRAHVAIVQNLSFLRRTILIEMLSLAVKQREEAYQCAGGVCEGQQLGWHPS